MKGKTPSEKAIDEAIEEQFKSSPAFVAWFLERTKIKVRGAKYRWSRSNHPWGKAPLIQTDPKTGLHEKANREGETDILVVFECVDGSRFAVHIENKVASPFTDLQPEMYAARAAHWIGSSKHGNYTKFKTALVAPVSFYERWEQDARKFDVFVPYEELAPYVPLVGEALSSSRAAE